MTIDQRLEALTQSVELLAGIQRDSERGMKQTIDALAAGQRDNERRYAPVMESMNRLISTVEANERRRKLRGK